MHEHSNDKWNDDKQQELNKMMENYQENGVGFKKAEQEEIDGNSFIRIGMMNYFANPNRVPEIDRDRSFKLNGQCITYNYTGSENAYQMIAAYVNDIEFTGYDSMAKTKGYVFMFKDGKPYVFEVKGSSNELIEVTSGSIYDRFKELSK